MLSGNNIILEGRVVDGRGEAAGFMSVDWVREQCRAAAGFAPFTGTLNLKVNKQDFAYIRGLASARGSRLVPPAGEDAFCEARVLRAEIHGIPAALLYPMVDDHDYYDNIVEIIAPLKLKSHLGLARGDLLSFPVALPEKLPFPEGIIFDLDGTLVDSVGLFYSILHEGMAGVGLPVPPRDKVMEFIGSGAGLREAWQALELNGGGMNREKIREQCLRAFTDIWDARYEKEVRLFPGARVLLNRLLSSGIALGVVTSSFYENKMDLFTRNGLPPGTCFRSVITPHDTVKIKPDPEPVRLCLSRMGLRAGSAVFVGDSPCDLEAGRAAGLITVGVLTGAGTRRSLSCAGADVILDSAADIPAHFDLGPERP